MCDTADYHILLQFVVTAAYCLENFSGIGPLLPSVITGKNKEIQNEYYEFTSDFNTLDIRLNLTHPVD